MTRSKKARNRRPVKLVRNLVFGKRAISVALTTMIMTAGVIVAGIAVLYWAYSWGNIANDQYANNTATNQEAIGENLAFEYISYSGTQLRVYVINCGISDNVILTRIYIWDQSNVLKGTYNIGQLYRTSDNSQISTLNRGDEGYFSISSLNLSPGYYTLRVVTESGRNFDGSFSF